MNIKSITKSAIILLIMGLTGSVNAELYRVNFTGEVRLVGVVFDGITYNNLGDTVQIGDIVTGDFIYDDSVSDSDISETYGRYSNAVSEFSITINNQTSQEAVLTAGLNTGSLTVQNDSGNPSNPADVFLATTNRPEIVSNNSSLINGESLKTYQFGLVSYINANYENSDIFDSDATPIDTVLNAFPTLLSSNGVNWMQFTSDNADFDVSAVTDAHPQILASTVYNLSSQIRWKLTNVTATKISKTPEDAVKDLVSIVVNLNIESGLSNSLDSKLESVLNVVDDLNENNDVAAINSLYAFIHAVEAQRGKSISDEDANKLIDAALAIIDSLDAA